MYCLNQRIGILFRENLVKKSFQMRYFFFDDEGLMFHLSSLPRLQKVIRLSKDIKEIKAKLLKMGEKSINLHAQFFSPPKPYTTEAVMPFSNRRFIEMKQKDAKQPKDPKQNQKTCIMLFGFLDEDTTVLYDAIMQLTGKQKKEPIKRRSSNLDKKQEEAEEKVFNSYISCRDSFSMSSEDQNNQYEGETEDSRASGKGKQILANRGMSFNGTFREGQKHGRGYLVNENLDTMECEFLNDELAGI